MTERAWLAALLRRMLAPVDAAWLAAFRVLFGLAMVASMLRYVAFGWIDELFLKPSFHFKYWGFAWVEPLPAPLMHALIYVLAVLALCVALGFCFRVSAFLFALGFLYVQLIDVATYLNHYYLATLLSFLLALSPAGRAFSLDARLLPERARTTVAFGWHALFRLQIGIVYTFAGLAKASSDWLIDSMPLRIWLGSRTDMPLLGQLFQEPWAAPAMSWAGFLFDTTISLWLLWRVTRPYAYVVVLVFHAVTSALFPIGMFPVIMVTGALLMFSPSWPRALCRALLRSTRGGAFARWLLDHSAPPAPLSAALAPRGTHVLALCLVALYAVFSVAMPLRHLVYGGSVLWHEQGMRFSWRVMVREKNGSILYVARDKLRGVERTVSPKQYLARWQEQEMWGQPDLILQLGQHIHGELERREGRPFEVRVEALVSLNGRPARHLIDPRVDLARVRDGVWQAPWITPSPRAAPPHLKPVSALSRPTAYRGS